MKKLLLSSAFFSLSACGLVSVDAQIPINENGKKLFLEMCASCHGADMSGGMAPSMADDVWNYGGTDAEILKVISEGIDSVGMPGFGDDLSETDQKDILAFIRSGTPLETTAPITDVPSVEDQVKVEPFIEGLEQPWALAFYPDSANLLITEKDGKLIQITGNSRQTITSIPEVSSRGQGGLFDVAFDPNYKENGWVYLIFAHPSDDGAMTKLVRGKISGTSWIAEQTLFEGRPEHYNKRGVHFGGRITFDNAGRLYFSVGDRGKQDMAQDTNVPNGKIHRINTDGSIPDGNPFPDSPYPSIYSYGNRNPQGLVIHPETQTLWETEHGPKGGDELNKISGGKNYGWPVISYGRNYSGTELTPYTAMPGMEQPESQWTPSIAVCGLDVYTGELFPEWKGRLLAGALKYETVRLIDVSGDTYQSESILLNEKGRVRDVTTGPNGAIYVALPNSIVRLSPK